MIKAVSKKDTSGEMKTSVLVNGNGREILNEFLGIIKSLKEECPELLIVALQIAKEAIYNDN